MRNFRYNRGKLNIEFQKGRRLWKEKYVGPDKLKQGDSVYDEDNWKVVTLWYVKRGDEYALSKKWWRVCLGKSWFAFRRSPFIFKLTRYTRDYDLYVRWN